MKPISIIVACSNWNVIGDGETMPWHIPSDLKYFKGRTEGGVVIMGRKTYESIGKPLPNRINIVLSRNKDFTAHIHTTEDAKSVMVVDNLDEAIRISSSFKEKETFVIGGGQIYEQAMEYDIHRLYITWVSRVDYEHIQGTVLFPLVDFARFKRIDMYHHTDGEYELEFTTYKDTRND